MLELSGVRLARGRFMVLEGFDLRLRAGTLVQVSGPNGSGKTTLLRAVAGLGGVRSGEVVRRARRAAFVPERIVLAPDVRAAEWAAAIRRMRRGAPALSDDELVAAGIAPDAARRAARRLSKGQVQRVALAEALGCGADLLALDEPWAGLDAEGRDWLAGRLDACRRAGAAVLFSDHTDAQVGRLEVDAVVRLP